MGGQRSLPSWRCRRERDIGPKGRVRRQRMRDSISPKKFRERQQSEQRLEDDEADGLMSKPPPSDEAMNLTEKLHPLPWHIAVHNGQKELAACARSLMLGATKAGCR